MRNHPLFGPPVLAPVSVRAARPGPLLMPPTFGHGCGFPVHAISGNHSDTEDQLMPVGNPGALFQRRHYEAIAAVVRSLGCVTEFERRNIALEFSLLIEGTNSAFNADRFIAACMPPVVPAPCCPLTVQTCWCSDVATRQHVSQETEDIRYFCDRHAGSCRTCTPLAADN